MICVIKERVVAILTFLLINVAAACSVASSFISCRKLLSKILLGHRPTLAAIEPPSECHQIFMGQIRRYLITLRYYCFSTK